MTKNAWRGCALVAVLLAAFCVIAFLIPFSKTAVYWIGFGFGAFAILFQLYILKTAFGGNGGAKSRFYGFPVARVGLYYLAAQGALSLLEMALARVLPRWVALAPNLLLLIAALLGCLFVETVRSEISRQDDSLKRNVAGMRELQSLSRTIAAQCGNEQLKKELVKLADDFRYSDPITSAKTQTLEAQLLMQLNDLQQAVTDGDAGAARELCQRLKSGLAERNRISSISK